MVDRPVLLLVRLGPQAAASIARNPSIAERFRVVTIDQQPIDAYERAGHDVFAAALEDRPYPDRPERTRWLLERHVAAFRPAVAIVSQPLLWYSEVAADVLRGAGARVFFSEQTLGERLFIDERGAPYCPENEIPRWWRAREWEPCEIPGGTKLGQPQPRTAEGIWQRYGIEKGARPLVLFLQVPGDMAVERAPWDYYLPWVRALILRNPQLTILAKHHPSARTPLPAAPNLIEVDESVASLFEAFTRFASYSSTVILEGVIGNRVFITGGFHPSAVLLPPARAGDADPYGLDGWPCPHDREQLLRFLFGRYALAPDDPRLGRRLTVSAAEWYS